MCVHIYIISSLRFNNVIFDQSMYVFVYHNRDIKSKLNSQAHLCSAETFFQRSIIAQEKTFCAASEPNPDLKAYQENIIRPKPDRCAELHAVTMMLLGKIILVRCNLLGQ